MGSPVSDRRAWAAEVVATMSGLDVPQAVLRCHYFGGLNEAQTATTTGLAIGPVRTAAAAGLTDLGHRIVSTGSATHVTPPGIRERLGGATPD